MKHFFILFIILLYPLHSWALTLDEVIGRVTSTHPAIGAKELDAKATKAKIGAEAWLNDPQVMLEWERSHQTNYKISQAIPFPTTLITKGKSVQYAYKSKLGDLSQTQREKILEAKQTFYALIANQHQISHLNNVVSSYEQLINSLSQKYETTADKQDSGANNTMEGKSISNNLMQSSNLSDLLMAKTKKSLAEVSLHDYLHQKGALVAKLNLLMGYPATKALGKITEPTIKKLKQSDSELERALLSQNGTLQSLQWMIKKYGADASLARQSLLPTVTPEWSYNKIDNGTNGQTFGLGFNVPIWLNRNASSIKSASLEKQRAKKELEAEALNLKSELYYLTNHAREHYMILSKYRTEILPTVKSAATIAQTAYESGLIPAENLMLKLIDYNETGNMYWGMWVDYQTEYALLEQLVGETL